MNSNLAVVLLCVVATVASYPTEDAIVPESDALVSHPPSSSADESATSRKKDKKSDKDIPKEPVHSTPQAASARCIGKTSANNAQCAGLHTASECQWAYHLEEPQSETEPSPAPPAEEGEGGCEDHNAKVAKATGGQLESCQEAKAKVGCDHPRYGKVLKRACPKTCNAPCPGPKKSTPPPPPCTNNDHFIMTHTGGQLASCKEAVTKVGCGNPRYGKYLQKFCSKSCNDDCKKEAYAELIAPAEKHQQKAENHAEEAIEEDKLAEEHKEKAKDARDNAKFYRELYEEYKEYDFAKPYLAKSQEYEKEATKEEAEVVRRHANANKHRLAAKHHRERAGKLAWRTKHMPTDCEKQCPLGTCDTPEDFKQQQCQHCARCMDLAKLWKFAPESCQAKLPKRPQGGVSKHEPCVNPENWEAKSCQAFSECMAKHLTQHWPSEFKHLVKEPKAQASIEFLCKWTA